MKTQDLVLRDSEALEEFYVNATGMKPGFLQLSPGVINLHMRAVELNDVTLVWVRSHGRTRWRDVMMDGGLHFGFAIESQGPITSRGRDVNRDEAQVWMLGQEIDYIMEGPLSTLEIGVNGDLIDELGWRFRGEPTRKVPRERLVRLTRVCHHASLAIQGSKAEARSPAIESEVQFWRDQILDNLEPVLQPWLAEQENGTVPPFKGTRDYRVVSAAETLLESLDHAQPLNVDLLSQTLGVHRRSLFYAFRKALGVGPRRYFELKRLYALRAQLRQTADRDATVTTIATRLGFTEMGRLAGTYKRYFGETPSETLKQKAAV